MAQRDILALPTMQRKWEGSVRILCLIEWKFIKKLYLQVPEPMHVHIQPIQVQPREILGPESFLYR